MAQEFESNTCPVCQDAVNPDVPSIEEKIPGATVIKQFCTVDCYFEYLAHTAKRTQTPDEYVREQLEAAGMDPDAFDARQDTLALFGDD